MPRVISIPFGKLPRASESLAIIRYRARVTAAMSDRRAAAVSPGPVRVGAGDAAVRPPAGDEHQTRVDEFPAVEHAQDVVLAARERGQVWSQCPDRADQGSDRLPATGVGLDLIMKITDATAPGKGAR